MGEIETIFSGEFFTIGCGKMVTRIKDMAVICQWCGVCYAGSKKCLDRGFKASLTPDIGVVKEGYCKLCKEHKMPLERRDLYKQK